MQVKDISKKLESVGYITNDSISWALSGTINQRIPLIIEGAPGVGKTFLAKALAEMLKLPLYRVQFYEGLTCDKILYDYDYQRQLLTIQAIRSTLDTKLNSKSIEDAINTVSDVDFYGKQFLIERPILKSITGDTSCVLLLDEVDKSSEEIEYALLEFLDDFSITIPQMNHTIHCDEDKRPMVLLTSNNYRDMSDALKRRCNYLYIEPKSKEEVEQILISQAKIDDTLASGLSEFIVNMRNLSLKQIPSIAEAVTWAKYIKENSKSLENEGLDKTIYMLAKNKDDYKVLSREMQKLQ